MKPQRGLGKGLRALIAETESGTVSADSVNEIAVVQIDPNPFQPRREFPAETIAELRDSILQKGVLQPILVRRNGDRYQLVVGERRWRACMAAGLASIPALIREVESDEEMLEIALLENVQREDLNPIEIARSMHVLHTTCGLTQEAIAEKIGFSRAHVTNILRLLKLSERIQAALASGKITMGHARSLLSVSNDRDREKLFDRFMADGNLSVRAAEEMTRKVSTKSAVPPESPTGKREALEIARLEDLLQRKLGTRVKIKPRGKGGTVEIHFYTAEDLQRLLELLER